MLNQYLNKYVGILLNIYDKELIIEDLEKVEELNLNYYDFSGEPNDIKIEELKYFKNLRSLRMVDFDLNEEDFNILRTLNKLENLELNNCTISNEDSISELLKLRSIELRNMNIKSLEFCTRLSDLKRVSLKDSKIKSLAPIRQCRQLEYLDLEGVGDINLEFLLKFNNLKFINLSKQQLTQVNLSVLKILEQSEEFSYEVEMKYIY